MTTQLQNALKSFFSDPSKIETAYYVRDIRDNTFLEIPQAVKKMFDNGNGGEFVSKGNELPKSAAIHSSSMLAFNFFGWINKENPFEYDGVRYDKAVFEEQLRVLKYGTKNIAAPLKKSQSKANMDVVLAGKSIETGRTSLLFIESKFTEHLTNNHSDMTDMVLSYSVPECYFSMGTEWSRLVNSWKSRAQDKKAVGYFSGIKQDICHLIAISNLMNGDTREWFNTVGSSKKSGSWLKSNFGLEIKGDEEFRFRNIVFSPGSMYADDNNYVTAYENLYDQFEKEVSPLIPPTLGIGLITYAELWEEMKNSIRNEALKNYLEQRYIRYQL